MLFRLLRGRLGNGSVFINCTQLPHAAIQVCWNTETKRWESPAIWWQLFTSEAKKQEFHEQWVQYLEEHGEEWEQYTTEFDPDVIIQPPPKPQIDFCDWSKPITWGICLKKNPCISNIPFWSPCWAVGLGVFIVILVVIGGIR